MRETRAAIKDRISDYYDAHGWPKQLIVAGPNLVEDRNAGDVNSVSRDDTNSEAVFPPIHMAEAANAGAPNAFDLNVIAQAVAQIVKNGAPETIPGTTIG